MWCRKSLSPSTIPARKAPRAADTPTACAAAAAPVHSGSATLKDACNEALRDWSGSYETAHYMLGTAAGPHPYPTIVREFQRMIGEETKAQILEREGRLPDADSASRRILMICSSEKRFFMGMSSCGL